MGKSKKKEKYLSMKWEILSFILPVVLCITVVVLGIIYFSSRNALIEKEKAMISQESATGSATIGQWTKEIAEKVNMAAQIIQEDRLGSKEEVNQYVADHQDLIDGCDDGLYIVYTDGTCLNTGGKITREPAYLEEAWYQFCASNQEAAFDACSYFEEDGKAGYSVTVGRQLLDRSGNLMGIIAIDAYLDGINKQVSASKDTTDGNILVVDQKSNMVIATTQEGLSGVDITDSEDSFLQAIHTDLINGALKQSYEADGDTCYTAASIIPESNWVYIVYVDEQIALASLKEVRDVAVVGVVLLILLITVVCILSIGLQMKELGVVEKRITMITDGQFLLDEKKQKKRHKNEIVVIHENLNQFIQKMIQMIKIIFLASQNLSHHAQVFSDMAEELKEDATTESMAVSDLTSTIGEMTGAVQSLAENASDLAGIVQNTQAAGIDAGERMQEVDDIVQKSNEDITNVSDEMKKVEISMGDLEELVLEVSGAAEQINSITGVIKSIAEETNLLSLNASIEAARAGEHGRGFAVVAEQIKGLANTSEQNAEAIEKLIVNISTLIEKTSQATKENVTGMKVSFDKLEETTVSFHHITEVVNHTKEKLDALVKDIAHVDQIATDIAAISEEQAASSEEILATTQTVNENVEKTKEKSEKIKEGTSALSIAAKDLENEMQFFKI